MDTSGSDELNTTLESNFSEEANDLTLRRADRPSPFTLRSQCNHYRCPQGAGIFFRSRISPSPSKQRVRTRRRRRSDQSHLDSSANTTLTSLDQHHHHHVESPAQEPRLLRSGEMLRQPSRTPRRKKATTGRVESTESQQDSRDNGGRSLDVSGRVVGFAETVKEKVLGFLTPSQKALLPSIVESSESGFEEGSVKGGTVCTSSPSSEVFVGAREFFAERETREHLSSDYWSSSDTPSKLRESTRRLSIRKPFNQYIAYSSEEELDDWWNQARSDYTYSASLTYRDRVTPDRKIGSPNMARRGLRGGNVNYIQSPDFSASDLSFEAADSSHLNLRTRTVFRPMDAFSDTSDGEAELAAAPVARRTRSSRSRSTDVVPRVNGSTITRTVTSSYTTTRTLHRGLDAESDVDDGIESTVPRRATPLTARGGTPLTRANSRASVSGDGVGRGYMLAKGAIAEDVEEEEAENEPILSWRTLSWHSVKRITTYITTTVIMMAVRTVTPQHAPSSESISTSRNVSKLSLWSIVNSSSQRVVGAGANVLAAVQEHLRKKPVLIWIPLIPLLIILALCASWWLMQSGAKTGDSADPTQTTEGPSFMSYILSSATEITNLVINGICFGPSLAWEALTNMVGCVFSLCSVGLSALWASVMGMATWLGSLAYAGLTIMLQTLFLLLEFLRLMALAVTSFFSSSVSYVFGFLFPPMPTNGSEGSTESGMWSWSASPWLSHAYTGVLEAAQTTRTWVWDGWLWLVISVADALSAVLVSFLWLLSFVWSLLWFIVHGLWTVLVYIFTGTVGFFSSAATTVTSLVVEVLSAVASAPKLLFLPLFKTLEPSKKEPGTLYAPQPSPVDSSTVTVAGMSIEDIVSRVLESPELKALVTSVSSQSTAQSQPTLEDIHFIIKSLVEGELREHKAETAALWESHTKTMSQESKTHMLAVEEKHKYFLTQLELLGAEVVQLQSSVKAGQEGQLQHHEHLDMLSTKIKKLTLQLKELESNHTTLASEVKSCCRNTSVTLADVEKHVTTLLGDVLGLSSGQGGATKGSWSVADMGAWLRSYFVAKEELETRLNTLIATLHRKSTEDDAMMESTLAASNTAVAQSTQMIMDTVLEKLRAEMQQQHAQLVEDASQQVNTQMQAAAAVLGQQMSEQVEHELHSSKQQLQNSFRGAVEEAVPKHVASAVPEAVNSAVSEAVATSVPNAVSSAVSGIVTVTVEGAVEAAVNAAVDSAVNEAVANAVPGAVQEALPQAVNTAVKEAVAAEVQGAITLAVSEVVASVLPSAVSTAVNESVTSKISEALVDAKISKAGGTYTKEMNGEEMVVGSGTDSDTSSSGGAILSATVNVSNNGNGSNLFAPVSLPMTVGLNESAVIRIVKEALLKYDADKTGMVDHALESAGGNIISTRCTESYQVHLTELSILGVPLFRYPTNNNPRIIIQPERMPGQCWAFKGSQGYIVIKLAGSVLPTGFTMEHIPKSLSPSGKIDSAPREFEVWGLHSENDEGVFLGSYEYDQTGDPFQYFAVKKTSTEYFPMIELKINSNHGNLLYTCLYRFRVHGVRYF